jgi:serine phosphatase RsbU (regulator of sigma subunit)/anti-sigma regulatory factor (Ser/Thr protein kinase)
MSLPEWIKNTVDALLAPACIVRRDLTVAYCNREFLEFCRGPLPEPGATLTACLNLEPADAAAELVEKCFTQKTGQKQRPVTGQTLHGDPVRLELSGLFLTMPGTGDGQFALLNFKPLSDLQEDYRRRFERERAERDRLDKTVWQLDVANRSITEFNLKLNLTVEEKDRALQEAQQKLQSAYTTLNQELKMAQIIQEGMLPSKLPEFLNLVSSGIYIPAGQVGGDLYDLLITPTQKIAVLIFDVSGHGISAALISVMAKMLFAYCVDHITRPSDIFTEVNRRLCESIRTEHFITAFLGILDPVDNSMVFSRAGHTRPLWYSHRKKTVQLLDAKSPVLGAFGNAKYTEDKVRLEESDKVLFYTDGLTEASNSEKQLFGTRRLEATVLKYGMLPLDEFLQKILAEQNEFRMGSALKDDISLLGIQTKNPQDYLRESGFAPEEKYEVLFLHTEPEIKSICAIILKSMDSHGWSDQNIKRVRICLHEIIKNALIHGNKRNPAKRVILPYQVTAEKVAVGVIDEGTGFNHSVAPDPTLPENVLKPGGRGLYILRHYMDTVEFNQAGNRIKITKVQKPV